MTEADLICDAIVDGLQAVDMSADWGFTQDADIASQSLPEFKLIDGIDKVLIRVSPFPSVTVARLNRNEVRADVSIGIGIVKKIAMNTAGVPDEDDFRALKGLAESIYMWAWKNIPGYEGKVSEINFPAWYDFEKAKQGIFITTIQPVLQLGFDI